VLHLLEQSRVTELELESEEGSRFLRLSRLPTSTTGVTVSPTVSQSVVETTESRTVRVESTLVGRFHMADPPPSEGDDVTEEEILGAVESMGLMNVVVAPAGGGILGVWVEEGQPVEYGQLLFEIESSAADVKKEPPVG
jgi:biotin carboxyl carrier protein